MNGMEPWGRRGMDRLDNACLNFADVALVLQ